MDVPSFSGASGGSANAQNVCMRPVIILAPPGCGKTHFVAEKKKVGDAKAVHDADDILSRVPDVSHGVPVIEAQQFYGADWDKWQRVCFRELLKKMNTEPDKYAIILTGFMVPKPGANEYDKERVLRGYSQFIGTGDITNWKKKPEVGFRKIDPKQVRVVLPDTEEYKRRGASRVSRPVPSVHCELCCECLHQLARSLELQVFASIEAAVKAC